jgi:hypothetical protein
VGLLLPQTPYRNRTIHPAILAALGEFIGTFGRKLEIGPELNFDSIRATTFVCRDGCTSAVKRQAKTLQEVGRQRRGRKLAGKANDPLVALGEGEAKGAIPEVVLDHFLILGRQAFADEIDEKSCDGTATQHRRSLLRNAG